jgi:hypothetical protein
MDGFVKFLIFCVLITAIGALAVFWPGQYQYYNTQDGALVRINRYTSETEYYTQALGWAVAKPTPLKSEVARDPLIIEGIPALESMIQQSRGASKSRDLYTMFKGKCLEIREPILQPASTPAPESTRSK